MINRFIDKVSYCKNREGTVKKLFSHQLFRYTDTPSEVSTRPFLAIFIKNRYKGPMINLFMVSIY